MNESDTEQFNPTQTLAQIRRLAYLMRGDRDDTNDSTKLAQLIEDLDGWITAGGSLPDTWEPL